MKVRTWMAVAALALGLSAPAMADAATYFKDYGGATLIVTQNSATDFTFEVKDATANWAKATTLDAFAFNDLFDGISPNKVNDTLTVTYGAQALTSAGGGNTNGSGAGCTSSGNFYCWAFSTPIAVTSDMTFDVSITKGSTNFNFAPGGPDLKIQFGDSSKKALTADYFSKEIPLCTTGLCVSGNGGGGDVPEPASWAMMLVGIGAIGGVLRSRRTMATATA